MKNGAKPQDFPVCFEAFKLQEMHSRTDSIGTWYFVRKNTQSVGSISCSSFPLYGYFFFFFSNFPSYMWLGPERHGLLRDRPNKYSHPLFLRTLLWWLSQHFPAVARFQFARYFPNVCKWVCGKATVNLESCTIFLFPTCSRPDSKWRSCKNRKTPEKKCLIVRFCVGSNETSLAPNCI